MQNLLKHDPNSSLPKMTADQKVAFEDAVDEEMASKDVNVAAAKLVAPRLLAEAKVRADVVDQLRTAREAAGVSLSELESRAGIRKSALSRLENSQAPNPTLATLRRYTDVIGLNVVVSFEKSDDVVD
ncbi:MAG: helix-turn-helix transcriptional regulator [Pirellulaceae bacterium]